MWLCKVVCKIRCIGVVGDPREPGGRCGWWWVRVGAGASGGRCEWWQVRVVAGASGGRCATLHIMGPLRSKVAQTTKIASFSPLDDLLHAQTYEIKI